MGVLTRTLAAAAPDILNFFVLWALIFLGYAFMGHLIVGSSVEYVSIDISLFVALRKSR
jgi:hypothetical protein